MAERRRALKAKKYIVNERCTVACSLGEFLLPGDMFQTIHAMFEAGNTRAEIRARSLELNHPLSTGAIQRHYSRHLTPESQAHTMAELEAAGPGGPKLDDLEIIERLIQRGASSLADKKVRVGPEMLMKAMELKYKLTQGNVFQGFLDAVNQAMAEPAEEPPAEPETAKEAPE